VNHNSAYQTVPGRMTNEQLAHELLLDQRFQLDDAGGSEVENPACHRIRESFHKAFWDSLVDDLMLHPNPCYFRMIRVLGEIRDGIADLAGTTTAIRIAEIIDIDFINRQVEAGAYDWSSCVRLSEAIIRVVRQIQEPRRDAKTAEKWILIRTGMTAAVTHLQRARAMCKSLEFLLECVNLMRVDAANAR
jgi:hypothetical protein